MFAKPRRPCWRRTLCFHSTCDGSLVLLDLHLLFAFVGFYSREELVHHDVVAFSAEGLLELRTTTTDLCKCDS